jgi:hypothetical protein
MAEVGNSRRGLDDVGPARCAALRAHVHALTFEHDIRVDAAYQWPA